MKRALQGYYVLPVLALHTKACVGFYINFMVSAPAARQTQMIVVGLFSKHATDNRNLFQSANKWRIEYGIIKCLIVVFNAFLLANSLWNFVIRQLKKGSNINIWAWSATSIRRLIRMVRMLVTKLGAKCSNLFNCGIHEIDWILWRPSAFITLTYYQKLYTDVNCGRTCTYSHTVPGTYTQLLYKVHAGLIEV